jgi:hypothetical protein
MARLVSVVWRQTASSLGPPGRECGMACCGMYLLVRYWQSLVVSSQVEVHSRGGCTLWKNAISVNQVTVSMYLYLLLT